MPWKGSTSSSRRGWLAHKTTLPNRNPSDPGVTSGTCQGGRARPAAAPNVPIGDRRVSTLPPGARWVNGGGSIRGDEMWKFLLGAAVGYVLGARAGHDRYEQLRRTYQRL